MTYAQMITKTTKDVREGFDSLWNMFSQVNFQRSGVAGGATPEKTEP